MYESDNDTIFVFGNEQEKPSNDDPHNLDEYFPAVNIEIVEQVVEQMINEGL